MQVHRYIVCTTHTPKYNTRQYGLLCRNIGTEYVQHIHPNTIQGYMGSYAGLNGGYLSSSTRRYLTTFYAKTQHVGPSRRTIFTSPLQDSTMATSIDNIYHIYLLDITHLKEVEEDLLFFCKTFDFKHLCDNWREGLLARSL